MNNPRFSVLVTGGAGYIGSQLVPALISKGMYVHVLDNFFYGNGGLESIDSESLNLIRGDIRDRNVVADALSTRPDGVIHLAAISNDPSSELDPKLTKSVNLDATRVLMEESRKAGVRRFVYASSASVYGLKEEDRVDEELTLDPLTIYAKYKAEGEKILNDLIDNNFTGVSLRAATVCGWAPRLRLDLTVNILTLSALSKGVITVLGGDQYRPNVHVLDVVDAYVALLNAPPHLVNGEAFNWSHQNSRVRELAEIVASRVGPEIRVDTIPTDDHRSYRLNADKIRETLGLTANRTISSAVDELVLRYRAGDISNPDDTVYRNVKHMSANPYFWVET